VLLIVATILIGVAAVSGCAHTTTTPQTGGTGASGLIVKCNPCDATVVIDGMPAGQARELSTEDSAYPLVAGRVYRVEIIREGYRPYVKEISLGKGLVTIDVSLHEM